MRTHRLRSCALLAALILVAAPVLSRAEAPGYGASVTQNTDYCAGLGQKQIGTEAGSTMAAFIQSRFSAAGLATHVETFHMPVFAARSVTLQLATGDMRSFAVQAFNYSGSGDITADAVYVGSGRAQDYQGLSATGKIVIVRQDQYFHRSAQLEQVEAHGGAAMLYISGAPDNLIQVGSVRFAQYPAPSIPTISIGADDGAALLDLLGSAAPKLHLKVDASIADGLGHNVLGVKTGTRYPDRIILVGGHYDTWMSGAVDNCSSMGSMLRLADEISDLDLPYTVMFGAWDAEEFGLTGSYDWVMKHQDLLPSIVFVENIEMAAASIAADGSNSLSYVFGTVGSGLQSLILKAFATSGHRAAPVPAAIVRAIEGGIIPTDLHPFYTAGVQGFSTFSETPYYHTSADVPDHLSESRHLQVTAFLLDLLTSAQSIPPQVFAHHPYPGMTLSAPAQIHVGESFKVRVRVQDSGRPLTRSGELMVQLNSNDHWPVLRARASRVGPRDFVLTVPAGAVRDAGTLNLTASISDAAYAVEAYGSVAVVP